MSARAGAASWSHGPVTISATRTDSLHTAQIQITDTAGRVTTGDSIITTLSVTHGRAVSQVLSGLSRAEGKIAIRNAHPGLTSLRVTVNG
jgi:hypothetical protein